MKRIPAFNNRVVFVMAGMYNIMSDLTRAAVIAEYPNYPNLGNDDYNQSLTNALMVFHLAYGTTVDIEFGLNEDAPENLKALRTFWQDVRPRCGHARAALPHFLMYLDDNVAAVWLDAWNQSMPQTLAPEEVRPETLETNDPNSGGGG